MSSYLLVKTMINDSIKKLKQSALVRQDTVNKLSNKQFIQPTLLQQNVVNASKLPLKQSILIHDDRIDLGLLLGLMNYF